jgi:hydrogenase nickel incorporation protein HypA/HybF
MHERSVVRALLRKLQKIMTEQDADRVVALRVCIGEFSGVEPALFHEAFVDLAQDMSFSGAELIVDTIPLGARCERCAHEFPIQRYRFECPKCGSRDVIVQQGDELLVDTVTLEGVSP